MATAARSMSKHPHVVIVGGGFGGLYAARALKHAPVRVTLIDRRNYHLFQPLLYQVATATLSPADIAQPIREILRKQRNVRVFLAEVTNIDLEAREVAFGGDSRQRRLRYDYLILAAGAKTGYFGHDEWKPLAPGLKSIEDALEVRRRLLLAYEAAEREPDEALRRRLLTFVIVGGGPTGVEMAGAMAEIARWTLPREFRSIDPARTEIYLLDAGPRLLPAMSESLAARAHRDLESLGVKIRTGVLVSGVDERGVRFGEERIDAGTVIWAAGVTAEPLGKALGVEADRGGRIVVGPDCTLPGHPEVFVVGDLAQAPGPDGKPLPGLAPVAMQQGRAAAANIARAIQGLPLEPFHYNDRGVMATIGRNRAVATIRGIELTGLIAWAAWAVIHVYMLIGFRNRILVSIQWLWAYVTKQRQARLITGSPELH